MTLFSRRSFLVSTVAASVCSRTILAADNPAETFVCPPCGCSMDHVLFDAPGRCPDCGMTLAPKRESDLGFEPQALSPGAGSFQIAGSRGRVNAHIQVHYYLPDGLRSDSRVLLIIPGAGRNSYEYRNAWLEVAREKNILIAALGYPEDQYDFAAYHMGGVMKNLTIENLPPETSGVIRLNDDDIKFDINTDKKDWLFSDFDRLFTLLRTATGLTNARYDIFGHSAGAQILHRLALFHPKSRADTIVAANAGFYTLPDLTRSLPTGLDGTGITKAGLVDAFAANLTLLLGENDDSEDAGGILLRTPTIDEQGQGRLSRGRYFYKTGQEQAATLDAPFHWRLETVPDVGHDFRAMSRAAREVLYP